MKKTLSLILAVSILGGAAAVAYADTQAPNEVITISEEAVEMAPETIYDKTTAEGIVKAVSEEQIEIEGLALNIDDNTLILDADLVPTQVKEGDLITAVVSTMTTRSLPPQAYAYYIIVRENPEVVFPIYMEVDEVKDGFIYSADGNYEVSYAESEVAMYRTKNIVKAEELTKGSAIFVYADVMTMSIPALVNPSKIVIMSVAQDESPAISKAEALHEAGVLLGTENGLELDREVTRAEAVALIQRTTPSNKKVYTSGFEDVPQTHWAYANISWAWETKIVNGVGENKFEPDRTVTAKELAMMLLNAQAIDAEFDNAFLAAIELGLVTAEDEILESDVLTRESASKMIYNYINK